mgnify:FL=1
MIDKNRLSIVIQGPLNKTSLNNIENYKKYSSNIIISCWEGDDIDVSSFLNSSAVTLLKNKIPDLEQVKKHYWDQSANHYYQIWSTHSGLCLCNTEYSMKVRSDEAYSNLDELLRVLEHESPNDIINIDWVHTATISDHLLLGNTKLLKDSFSFLANEYLKKNVPEYMSQYKPVEDIISETLVKFSTHKLTFPIVKVADLGKVLCVWNHTGRIYKNE